MKKFLAGAVLTLAVCATTTAVAQPVALSSNNAFAQKGPKGPPPSKPPKPPKK